MSWDGRASISAYRRDVVLLDFDISVHMYIVEPFMLGLCQVSRQDMFYILN